MTKSNTLAGVEITRRASLGLGAALGTLAATGPFAAAARAQAGGEHAAVALPKRPLPEGAPPLTSTISEYIAGIRSAPVEAEFLDLGKRHILDSLASAVACKDLEPAVLGRKYALQKSAGVGQATMLGTTEKAGLVDAAYGSSMIIHGSEINDFIPSAFVQPGPAVVGTAFAVAEARGGSGHDVLRACVAGYELCGRMPKALGVRNLYRIGLANHSVGPCFGGAATAASMLGLSAEQVQHVMSYASQQAAGSWQWLLDERHVEKTFVFAGLGARNGIEAALLVEAGYTGLTDCFDNEEAFMHQAMFAGGDHDPYYLIEDLESRSELPLTAYKRYPVGGPTQPAVEAVLALREKTSPSTLESIVIEMPGRWDAFRNAEMPALNLRYLSAIILLDGRLGLVAAQDKERFANDRKVRALMEKIDVMHAPDLEVAEGEERTEPARVSMTDRQTGEHNLFVPFVRGFPSHPMTRDDVEAKAMELMGPVLGDARAKRVVAAVRDIERLERASDLVSMIAS